MACFVPPIRAFPPASSEHPALSSNQFLLKSPTEYTRHNSAVRENLLQPLQLSAYTLVTPLGSGLAATLEALRAGRSGLSKCDFLDVDLDTYVGRVAGLENKPVRADLAAYDCRNNRLAQLGLEQDGFAAAVAAAKQRY